MVKGLDLFRARFRQFGHSFVLIGGAACDEWFTSVNLEFRATKDLDIVLIIEVIDHAFVAALRAFIADGAYEICQRTNGLPVLYRFAKPKDAAFPFMLELFSRRPAGLDIGDGQHVVPIATSDQPHSLSAILLDDDYFALIRSQKDVRDGLPFANATALIPLKAPAWLDLARCKGAGEKIDADDMDGGHPCYGFKFNLLHFPRQSATIVPNSRAAATKLSL